jgi:hypothetical protein
MATVARQPQTFPELSASAAGLRPPLPGTTVGRDGAGNVAAPRLPLVARALPGRCDRRVRRRGKNSQTAGKMDDLRHPSRNYLPMTTHCELPAFPAANRRVLAIRLSGPGRGPMRMIRIDRCPDDLN